MNSRAINIENSGTIVASGTHPFGAWFELTIKVNLNTNKWELLVNGVSQGIWSNTINQIWGIDIYPTDANPTVFFFLQNFRLLTLYSASITLEKW